MIHVHVVLVRNTKNAVVDNIANTAMTWETRS